MTTPRFATVALPLHFKYHSGGFDGLTYSIPDEFEGLAQVGVRVVVPLGKRLVTGVIVSLVTVAPANIERMRPIADILDKSQVFDEIFLNWSRWIANYYLCSWGEVLEAALPQGLRAETKTKVFAIEENLENTIKEVTKRSKKRAEVLRLIADFPNGVFISHLTKRSKITGLYAHIRWLEDMGYVRSESQESLKSKPRKERVAVLSDKLATDSTALTTALMDLERAPKQARVVLRLMEQRQLAPDEPMPLRLLIKDIGVSQAVINSLHEKEYIKFEEREIRYEIKHKPITVDEIKTDFNLTGEQQTAHNTISEALDKKEAKTFLLHGITGSGKTEVYITLARKVIAEGGGVLVLVPEISLTPQLIDRFRKRLGANISVLHSRMSNAERLSSWRALSNGETRIAIGARSAVFAPVRNLRMIVVDEEHESTYKQYDKTPRYHARDAAVMRSYMLNAVCVLGSATPSIESYHNAGQGKYKLLKLVRRAQDAKLPPVRTVDMRKPIQRAAQLAEASSLSPDLKEAIALRLAKKQGVVLLQNRRGFSTYLGCSKCGSVVMCPNCAVSLTWHQQGNRMQCHYCGFMQKKSETCPTCGSEKMYLGGIGTERVEEELQKHFPEIRIARMDLDTTSKRGSFENLLRSFADGEADVLLGTQMVAKGLDFPRVTLVGVINADTSLCLPDFRSGERTFQLLTQVSGRAGRTEELAGEVLVQTMQPGHPAVLFASKHDYEGFYEKELEERRDALYPPYSRIILVEFRGANEGTVKEKARAFTTLIPQNEPYYTILGPAEPTIKKLRGEFRQHLVFKNLKTEDAGGDKMRRLLSGAMEQYQKRFASRAVTVTIDVDVQGVL